MDRGNDTCCPGGQLAREKKKWREDPWPLRENQIGNYFCWRGHLKIKNNNKNCPKKNQNKKEQQIFAALCRIRLAPSSPCDIKFILFYSALISFAYFPISCYSLRQHNNNNSYFVYNNSLAAVNSTTVENNNNKSASTTEKANNYCCDSFWDFTIITLDYYITSSWNKMAAAAGGDVGGKGNFEKDEVYHDVFPDNFTWGVATSSYQIEGGWNADGKGESIWDRFCHSDPSRIKDKSNGDIACDSYHQYAEDVKLVKELGAKSYRISISWSRILPKGTTEKVNQAGIDYYNKLINAMVAEGIEPMLTLYHWDLPQNLQEMGGWQNEELIGIFGDYARICYQNFGDRVKQWVTINEAYVFCIHGYDDGTFAPGIKDPAVSPYLCVHTVLKAHAMAYHIYKEEFSAKQKGRVGIAADSWWYEPAKDTPEDKEAAERALQFRLGWIMGPIFKGDYPPVMRQLIDGHSKLENRSDSRLPFFTPDWSARLKGSADFFGLNHYTTQLVSPAPPDKEHPSWSSDSETIRTVDPSWPSTGSTWLKMVPWGLRKLLVWIKNEYGNPEVVITENGCSDRGGILEDTQRVQYFQSYINEVLKAVKLDGCNVTGYFAWALMDVFEWNVGYTEKFGLYSVNFSDPNRTRTAKSSVAALQRIYVKNGFPAALELTEKSAGNKALYCSTTVLSLALIFLLIGAVLII